MAAHRTERQESNRLLVERTFRREGAEVHETVFCREMGYDVCDTYANRRGLRRALVNLGCVQSRPGFWRPA